jgi:predicted ATP-binding protein involved in virulence
VLEGLLRSGKNVELILSAELSYDRPLSSHSGVKKAKFKKITTGIKLSYTKKRELRDSKLQGNTRIETLGRFWEPLIVAYGANRQIGQQNLNLSDLDDPIASRLSGVTELYDAEEILNKLDHAAAKKRYKGLENDRLQRVKEILAVVLPDIEKAEDIKILTPRIVDDSNRPHGVRFKTFSGLVPLSALSLGYQTTLAWTVDLAWRLFRRYNNSRNPLAEPAIVLIDEIDLHLHPLWQRTIMDDLSRLFSKTQFIATAHSPSMVQAAPTANLAVVQKEKDEVRIENEPEVVRSWRVDQILTSELFGVPNSRGPDTERLFRERSELLNRIRRGPAEENRLKQLESELARIPTAEDPEDQKAMDIIRKAAALLKRERIRGQ